MSGTLCPVCETATHGFHLGVHTCRACAAFFRRTNKQQFKYTCRFNQNCNASHQNRYTCRHCRYRKCLVVGMFDDSTEVDDHQISVETSHDSSVNGYIAKTTRPLIPRTRKIILNGSSDNRSNQPMKDRIDSLFAQNSRVQSYPIDIPLSICQQALVAFSSHKASWPKSCIEKSRGVDVVPIVEAFNREIENIAIFCMSIQQFAELEVDQKWIVYRHFWSRFLELCKVNLTCNLLGLDTLDLRTVEFEGSIITSTSRVRRLNAVTDWDVNQIRNFMRETQDEFRNWFTIPLKKFAPDDFELMYMVMNMMWNIKDLDNVSAKTLTVAEKVTQRISDELYNYYTFQMNRPNYADRIYKLSHLLTAMERVYAKRKEDHHMSRIFNIFSKSPSSDSLDFLKKEAL